MANELVGDDAVALWKLGKDKWNEQVAREKYDVIDFSGVNFQGKFFAQNRDPNRPWDFAGYHFGDADVDFSDARFGGSDVDFSHSNFGSGDVSFKRTLFGNGDVSFESVNFGKGNTSFEEAKFGIGKVSFQEALFGYGRVVFRKVDFSDGDTVFTRTQFKTGDVDFADATFGKGRAVFQTTKFGKGHKSFSDVNFGDGECAFVNVSFGDGGITFNGSVFGEGITDFALSDIGAGSVSFLMARVHGILQFNPLGFRSHALSMAMLRSKGQTAIIIPRTSNRLEDFDLGGASFDGPLFIEGTVSGIPDLRSTKTSHHVDLSELEVSLRRQTPSLQWPPHVSKVASDRQDANRLRRLKEIAEANKDHAAALRFAADENRAKRWIHTPWLASVLDMAFSGFSNYGQSVLRPSVSLLLLIPLFALIYMGLSPMEMRGTFNPQQFMEHGAALSLSNTVPFLPPMVTTRTDTVDLLFPADNPGILVHAAMAAQSLLSLVFVFLIGLGLRNRFRL